MSTPSVGYAVMPIVPSLRGLDAEIKRQLGGPLDRAAKESGRKAGKSWRDGFGELNIDASSLTSFGLKAVAVGGVAALGLGKAAAAAGDLNAAISASGQVFGDAQGEIEAWSQGSADAIGLSRRAAVEAATSFGAFGKQAGLQGPELSKFSTGLTELAADLAAFKNVSVEEALQALQSGLAGESEPLRKYQVLLSDAQLRIEAVKLGLISTTQEALSPQNRVLAANSLIFEQATDKIGQFEREQGELGTTTQQMTANFEDAQAALGQALLPTLTSAAGAASDALQSFSELNRATQNAAGGIAAVAVGGTVLVGGLSLAAGAALKLSDAYGRVRDAAASGNTAIATSSRVATVAAKGLGAALLAVAAIEIGDSIRGGLAGEADRLDAAKKELLATLAETTDPESILSAFSERAGAQTDSFFTEIPQVFGKNLEIMPGLARETIEDIEAAFESLTLPDQGKVIAALEQYGAGLKEGSQAALDNAGLLDNLSGRYDLNARAAEAAAAATGDMAGAAGEAGAETEDLADAQKKLDAATGSLTRKQALLGFQFDSNAAAAQGYLNAVERTGSNNALVRAGVGVGSALRQLRDGINGTDSSAKAAEKSTDTLALSLDRMNAALDWSNPQLSLAATQLGAFKAAADAFRNSMESGAALRNQVSTAIQLGEAYRDFSKTVRRIPPEIDMVGLTLGKYRPRTVEALQSTLQLGSAFTDYLASLLAAGKGTEYVRYEADRFRNELAQQLRQAGLTDAQVQKYLETLNATPEAVETAIRVSGEEQARFKVQAWLQLLEGRIPEAVALSVGDAISRGDLEAAANQLQALAAQNPIKIPLNVDSEGTVAEAEKELLRLPPTIDFVKAALGGYTEEQERGIEAMLGLGDAAQEFISKLVGEGKTQQALDFAKQLGVDVEALARQMGASGEGAKQLLETLGLTPEQVTVGIQLAGFDRTVFEITSLLTLLDEDLPPDARREIALDIATGDLESAVERVKTEVLLLEQNHVELQIDALTDPATGQVNIWRAFTEANVFPIVPVGANTGPAASATNSWSAITSALNPTPKVGADTNPAADAVNRWVYRTAAQPLVIPVEAQFGASWDQLTWFLRPGAQPGGRDGDPRTPFRDGGLVTGPGTGTSDSIPAWLSNREYVIPELRVRQFGVDFFDQIRAGRLPDALDLKSKNPPNLTLAPDMPQNWSSMRVDQPTGLPQVHVDATYNEVREAPTPEDLVRGVGSGLWRMGYRG